MATKITREILEAYLYCKTKAHLKLAGQQRTVSDYEALLAANRQEVRQKAIEKILAKHPEEQVARDISLTVEELRTGPAYVLDASLEDDLVNLLRRPEERRWSVEAGGLPLRPHPVPRAPGDRKGAAAPAGTVWSAALPATRANAS